MDTIRIEFTGFLEVNKNAMALMTADGTPIDRESKNKLSAEQITSGLQDGSYMLDFMSCYINALNGSEEYGFSIPTD